MRVVGAALGSKYATMADAFRAHAFYPRSEDIHPSSIDEVSYQHSDPPSLAFLSAVAPFVEPGSYLEWAGADRWRHVFDGTTCRIVRPTLVWP